VESRQGSTVPTVEYSRNSLRKRFGGIWAKQDGNKDAHGLSKIQLPLVHKSKGRYQEEIVETKRVKVGLNLSIVAIAIANLCLLVQCFAFRRKVLTPFNKVL
jgi:hypothetical protein